MASTVDTATVADLSRPAGADRRAGAGSSASAAASARHQSLFAALNGAAGADSVQHPARSQQLTRSSVCSSNEDAVILDEDDG